MVMHNLISFEHVKSIVNCKGGIPDTVFLTNSNSDNKHYNADSNMRKEGMTTGMLLETKKRCLIHYHSNHCIVYASSVWCFPGCRRRRQRQIRSVRNLSLATSPSLLSHQQQQLLFTASHRQQFAVTDTIVIIQIDPCMQTPFP